MFVYTLNITHSHGGTVYTFHFMLHVLIMVGHLTVLQELLEACKNGRLEEVTRLIQKGVNVNIIEPSVSNLQ